MTEANLLADAREIDWDAFKAHVGQQLIDKLRADQEFAAATHLRMQVVTACRVLHDNEFPAVPYSVIGKLFGIGKSAVRSHLKSYAKHGGEEGPNGRPPLLTSTIHEALVAAILEAQAARCPWTMGQIREFIAQQCEAAGEQEPGMTRNTIWHMLRRDPRLKSCTTEPMEDKRMDVTAEAIGLWFGELFRKVSGVPAHFVFNLDEMGHQDWADRQKKTVYVSADFPGDIPQGGRLPDDTRAGVR